MALDFLLPSIKLDGENDFRIELMKTQGNKVTTLHQLKRSIGKPYRLIIESGDEAKEFDLPFTHKVFELNPDYALEITHVLQTAPTRCFGGLTGILPAQSTRYALGHSIPNA
jgi:hypothetical protein